MFSYTQNSAAMDMVLVMIVVAYVLFEITCMVLDHIWKTAPSPRENIRK